MQSQTTSKEVLYITFLLDLKGGLVPHVYSTRGHVLLSAPCSSQQPDSTRLKIVVFLVSKEII